MKRRDPEPLVAKFTMEPFPTASFIVTLLGGLGAMFTLRHFAAWLAGGAIGIAALLLLPRDFRLIFDPPDFPEAQKRRLFMKSFAWAIAGGFLYPAVGYLLSKIVTFFAPLPTMFFVGGGFVLVGGLWGVARLTWSRTYA